MQVKTKDSFRLWFSNNRLVSFYCHACWVWCNSRNTQLKSTICSMRNVSNKVRKVLGKDPTHFYFLCCHSLSLFLSFPLFLSLCISRALSHTQTHTRTCTHTHTHRREETQISVKPMEGIAVTRQKWGGCVGEFREVCFCKTAHNQEKELLCM